MGPSHPQASEALVRKGHLMGLKPVVLVTFQSPVNINHWKLEHLQIQMEAAPFRSKGEPEGLLEQSQGWQEHWGDAGALRGVLDGRLGSSRGPWFGGGIGLMGALSGVCGLVEGTGRPQQVPWPRWGYTKAPVGSMA